NGKYYIEMDVSSNSRSILDFSTNAGTTYFNDLMGEDGIFTNPKNVDLLKYLLSLIHNKNRLVIDFFSGSATTADAVVRRNSETTDDVVMSMNAESEDNNYKYLVVQ